MKYPAILESKSQLDKRIMLAFNKNECQCINSEQMSSYCGFDFDVSDRWKNITTEYLSNTWGVVESKEHAEFIKLLAGLHGFTEWKLNDIEDAVSFRFKDGELCFFSRPIKRKNGLKQITIPLPPKECLMEFEGRGGDASKGDEWPKVGDEVLAFDIDIHDGRKGVFIGKNKHGAPIVELESGSVILLGFEGKMQKPKTPEQKLFESFWKEVGLFMNQSNLNKEIFESAFINNITKKG